MAIVYGKIYDPEGRLWFEGCYSDEKWRRDEPWKPVDLFRGTEYWPNGQKHREGTFQFWFLLKGTIYYGNGQPKFIGAFIDSRSD